MPLEFARRRREAGERLIMTSNKRTARIGIPMAVVGLGLILYAQTPAKASCGHPTVLTAILQQVGLAHSQACETIPNPNGGPGEWCANVGHHCKDGLGPGKCLTVFDTSGMPSCECVK
jgi:hypothetical protein